MGHFEDGSDTCADKEWEVALGLTLDTPAFPPWTCSQ